MVGSSGGQQEWACNEMNSMDMLLDPPELFVVNRGKCFDLSAII